MANSTGRRNWLRKRRQEVNRLQNLTPEEIKAMPRAAEQYIIFGGAKGKSKGKPFEHFQELYNA